MPRAYSNSDFADLVNDPGAGEWHALRGELVALLDKVESRYSATEVEPQAEVTGLARRVRELRDQVATPETLNRREEALRSVKRSVERFSERDGHRSTIFDEDLTNAIAEIRQRQSAHQHEPARRMSDMPELRELGTLVGGMSQRLELLEGELKSQRHNGSQVHEVASQVEQLTQVVELIAGAVGETGQVKRLEAQISALAQMIETGSRTDLNVINRRLDDVSATVAKLAELQAEQMERELIREDRREAEVKLDPAAVLAPAMESIEESVRNVYDRIDVIERSVALNSTDFDRLTQEMAGFTQALKDSTAAPQALANRVEVLAKHLEKLDAPNGDVQALKADIDNLRNAVLVGLEPRFARIETQIGALSERISAVDTSALEVQLKAMMQRMDDASAQLDTLGRMYDPDAGLDYAALADMVAARTTEAIAKTAPKPVAQDNKHIDALETRMTALLNTTGKDTAERLARLEATLAARHEASAHPHKSEAVARATLVPGFDADDAFAQSVAEKTASSSRLDAILAHLGNPVRDEMPVNPGDEAPLVDSSFKTNSAPLSNKRITKSQPAPAPELSVVPPKFDPATVERPPQPRSSFESEESPTFEAVVAPKPMVDTPSAPQVSNTSTFVAAARRAQRARVDDAPITENSVISRALAFVRPAKDKSDEGGVAFSDAAEEMPEDKPKRSFFKRTAKVEAVDADADSQELEIAGEDEPVEHSNVLVRHRRPILLATALAAVSLLTLNLVMQRVGPASVDVAISAPAETPKSVETAEVAPVAKPPRVITNPKPLAQQPALTAPRVGDMVDTTATGSINPGKPMSFSRDATMPAPLSLPPLSTEPPAPDLVEPVTKIAPLSAIEGDAFELPAEATGPLELREAAAKGDAKAQYEIATIYGEGRAVPTDTDAAAKWYERSAAQGFVPAQYRLGNLYEAGVGVEKNLEQAKLWYQRAADGGNRMAMHNLAALHAGGALGEQQFEIAAQWFSRAAALGMVDSQFNLGMLYARGLGVEQNFENSYKYFAIAAVAGDKDAAQARADIARSLTAEAVQRLDAEVANWVPDALDIAANFAPIGTWSSNFVVGDATTNQDIVKRVQTALANLGYDVGTPDGVTGPKTVDAIRAFERATGMSESGAVNPRLLAVLGSQPV